MCCKITDNLSKKVCIVAQISMHYATCYVILLTVCLQCTYYTMRVVFELKLFTLILRELFSDCKQKTQWGAYI